MTSPAAVPSAARVTERKDRQFGFAILKISSRVQIKSVSWNTQKLPKSSCVAPSVESSLALCSRPDSLVRRDRLVTVPTHPLRRPDSCSPLSFNLVYIVTLWGPLSRHLCFKFSVVGMLRAPARLFLPGLPRERTATAPSMAALNPD